MPKPSRKTDVTQGANQNLAKAAAVTPMRSVMAEMGSKGGKIGGKLRAANMTPEARRASASLAAKTRWSGKPQEVSTAERQEIALGKIAALFEEQMTSAGLTEEEKDAKVADFSAYVREKVKNAKTSKSQAPSHSDSHPGRFQTA